MMKSFVKSTNKDESFSNFSSIFFFWNLLLGALLMGGGGERSIIFSFLQPLEAY